MTTRRSEGLDVPGLSPEPVDVLDLAAPPRLPFTVSPIAVLLMALRRRERAF